MGIVFRARRESDGAVHALKTLLGWPAGRPRARFEREIELARRLSGHRGIVAVHANGVHQGRPWYAMDLVDGTTLAASLVGGPLAPRDAVRIVARLADAVEHAHGFGVIHRDLKPENVLLDASGFPRIVDFGIAHDVYGEERLTLSGEITGTPIFMAPELVRGGEAARAVGVASDVYGLGAVLYACLTGRAPVVGESLTQVLSDLLRREPPPPSRWRDDIPSSLDRVCLRALASDPSARFPSAAALRSALLDPATLGSARSRRRSPLGVVAAVTLGAVLLAGAVGLLVAMGRRDRSETGAARELGVGLAAIEESLREHGPLDSDARARLEAIAVGAPGDRRRARLLLAIDRLARADDEEAEHAAAVDDVVVRVGGDPELAAAAVELLRRRELWPGLAGLAGAGTPLPGSAQGELARAVADGAVELGYLDPELLDELRVVAGLEPHARARIDALRGQRLLLEPGRVEDAIHALRAAIDGGAELDPSGWPDAVLARLDEAALVAIDGPADAAHLLEALAGRVTGRLPLLEAERAAKLQGRLRDLLEELRRLDDPTDEIVDRVLLLEVHLVRRNLSPFTFRAHRRIAAALGSRARLTARVQRALDRRVHDPAELVVLGQLVVQANKEGIIRSWKETVRLAHSLVDASLGCGVESPWLLVDASEALSWAGDKGRRTELLREALRRDRELPAERRIGSLPATVAEITLYSPGVESFREAFALLDESGELSTAREDRATQLAAAGVRVVNRSTSDGRPFLVWGALAEALLDAGAPACCGAQAQDVGLDPTAAIDRALEVSRTDPTQTHQRVAWLHEISAGHARNHGRLDEELACWERAVTLADEEAAPAEASRDARRDAAGAYRRRGERLLALDRLEEGLADLRASVERYVVLSETGPRDYLWNDAFTLADVQRSLITALIAAGRPDEAEAIIDVRRNRLLALGERRSWWAAWQAGKLAEGEIDLARIERAAGRPADAAAALDDADRLLVIAGGEAQFRPTRAEALEVRAAILRDAGEIEEAARLEAEASALRKAPEPD